MRIKNVEICNSKNARFNSHLANFQACVAQTKSLYDISHAMKNFYGTEIEIWAGLGLVGSTEKNGTVMSNFLGGGLFMFS